MDSGQIHIRIVPLLNNVNVAAKTRKAEDDLAEKQRSNDMLQKAIGSYRDAAELPDATPDLVRAALKRRAERQQFLGNVISVRVSMATTPHMQIVTLSSSVLCRG